MSSLSLTIAEGIMDRVTCCAGCGHGLIPMISAKGRAELSCLWCELIDARTVEMAKWADSPTGKPERAAVQSFD